MATRNIVPRTDSEGGIGTAIKRWGLGWINALVVNSIKIVTGASAGKILTSDAVGNGTWQSAPAGVTYATAAEDLAGAEAAKAIAPLTNPQLIKNLKPVVNAAVNKLDIFTKSGGAVPDASNIISVAIPDGNGYTFRSRAAAYLSGTSQFIMADAANYWSKGSLDAEIKTAYVYAIWDGTGIIWALGGYSGFTRVPASTTATDDDFFLLEEGSTYTKAVTEYCVCVGKIRYQYDTADTPDHTIQATVLDAPQVIWNPKSDYSGKYFLATTLIIGAADKAPYSCVNHIVKQSGRYLITMNVTLSEDIVNGKVTSGVRTGSSTFANAVMGVNIESGVGVVLGTGKYGGVSASTIATLNAGDTIHGVAGWSASAGGGNATLWGESNGAGGYTGMVFGRID